MATESQSDLEGVDLKDMFWTTTHVRKYINETLGLNQGNDAVTRNWMSKNKIPRLKGSIKTTKKLVDEGLKRMEQQSIEEFKKV